MLERCAGELVARLYGTGEANGYVFFLDLQWGECTPAEYMEKTHARQLDRGRTAKPREARAGHHPPHTPLRGCVV